MINYRKFLDSREHLPSFRVKFRQFPFFKLAEKISRATSSRIKSISTAFLIASYLQRLQKITFEKEKAQIFVYKNKKWKGIKNRTRSVRMRQLYREYISGAHSRVPIIRIRLSYGTHRHFKRIFIF